MKTLKIILLSLITLVGINASSLMVVSNTSLVEKREVIENIKVPDISELSFDVKEDDSTFNILNNYPDLVNIVKSTNIKIPVENKFIPQGIALVNNYYFIVGYYDNYRNSSCYILDEFGSVVNVVELDTNSHVGSISYDEKRNIIWIPGNNGVLNVYNVSDFFNKSKVKSIYKFNNVSDGLKDFQDSTRNLIAYLTIDGDYLYIGNFFIEYECLIKKYKIINTGECIDLIYISSFNVPKRTQSILFVQNNKHKYMLLSRSYGRSKYSYLYVYLYDDNITNYKNKEIIKIKFPPMLEQININASKVYLLFESNATKYWNSFEKMEYVLTINLDDLLNR